MSMENYQPQEIETKWYETWEKKDYFSPDHQDGQTYTIVIPPPNVTGSLHIGHALVNTLQDILIRWKRMCGYKTLWLPGTDHAGIATQMVVERELSAKGIKKEDLGREKFLEEMWKYKEKYGGKICHQLRRLGASLDWKRERFTLDEGLSRAVRRTFVSWYKEGLIYRGNYLVNWCPKDQTALSDLEVTHKNIEGELTHIFYPIEDGGGHIEIATTRPETMLGDTAVAVHPDDPRYQDIIGKKVRVPLVNRIVPVIADEFCNMEFGSGAVKVTPAHDPNDYLIGGRHHLEQINIFTKDGRINDVFLPLQGMERFEARKKVVELLKKEGFWKEVKEHVHSVGHCQRCSTVVEPRLSTQWFCKTREMAEASVQASNQGEIRFIPSHEKKIFHEWMENIQDWCISRQLWWGHRIPAWYCDHCGAILVSEEENIEQCDQCDSSSLTKEEDVLDTWFSSGLFPFSTMGWPDETEDMRLFYPNSTLITGYDILFFWVARMVMMGLKVTGQVPFPEVFLHGLVRDENNEKMSKTKGNVIDPLDIIEKYGADALRFTLTALTVMGRDVKLPESAIAGNRNFINKIWNATRFLLFHIEQLGEPRPIDACELGILDRWILNRLEITTNEVDQYLTKYRFNEVAKSLYSFVWHEFCDWYVEIVKPMLFGKLGEIPQQSALATTYHVLQASLRLLHPIIPFATEELWQTLPGTKDSIMVARYPKVAKRFNTEENAERIIELVKAIRNIRGENNVKPSVQIDILLVSAQESFLNQLEEHAIIIQSLAGIQTIRVVAEIKEKKGLAGAVGKDFEVYVNLAEAIDFEQEINRLRKELEKLRIKGEKIEKKLNNEKFLSKAPQEVVEKNRKELSTVQSAMRKTENNLATIMGN